MRRIELIGSVVAMAMAIAASGCARAVDGRGGGGGGGGGAADLGAPSDFAADGAGGGAGDLAAGGAAQDLASGGGAQDLASGGGAQDLASGGGAQDLAISGGVITGGPCLSGASGATAIRVRWVDSAGTASVQYEAFGMPDHARQKVSAYGYQFGFTPSFVDPFLGDGGLLLDGSDFVDVELSGAGITSLTSATLAIYGRSYDTTTSGSFSWHSFSDSGATATDFVSNVAPYHWYVADIGNTVAPGDAGVLVRIEAGPSSGSLVVNRIEICLAAQ